MPYTIRAAQVADARLLAAIDASVNSNPRTEPQFVAAFSPGSSSREIALLVERDECVSGFVLFSQVMDEASVHSIAVDPLCQRQGLGQLLLDAALMHMQAAGATRCLLEVRESNAPARRLYERSGFRLDGVRKNYYPASAGREDAMLMSLELKG
ncbi:MAG: ribosomal protein S18-alanine N-acetyltransferase [Halioglobus sp.]